MELFNQNSRKIVYFTDPTVATRDSHGVLQRHLTGYTGGTVVWVLFLYKTYNEKGLTTRRHLTFVISLGKLLFRLIVWPRKIQTRKTLATTDRVHGCKCLKKSRKFHKSGKRLSVRVYPSSARAVPTHTTCATTTGTRMPFAGRFPDNRHTPVAGRNGNDSNGTETRRYTRGTTGDNGEYNNVRAYVVFVTY